MSSEAIAKLTITKNSSEFKLDVYASISTGELVVFAVQVLQTDAAPVAVEEVVSTCFRFFPHSFALKNYFYWPDSALVTRRLHDAKEKGLLKGSPTEGYETKVKGRQVAKQTAKLLGVSLPVILKVEVPEPVVKKEEEKKPAVKKQAVKPKAKAKPKKEVIAPVKKKPAVKKTVKPAAKAVKQAPKPKAVVKKVEKKEERRKKEVRPTPIVKKASVKAAPKPKVVKQEVQKQEIKKKETKTVAKPTQLTLGLTPPAAKKKVEVLATQTKLKKEPQPVKVEVLAPVVVSKEEKDKAAKVVKQIERSDAYQLYRRNGKRAQIGEFDFRNMLFATMESSPETLKRNVELFKRYAGIHFRTDLIAFLEFCEESFSALLISKVKGKK